MPSFPTSSRRAIVVGGSLGGLFAGVLLRAAGWTVDIHERSPRDLDSRGGGIVLQPQVLEAFRRGGVAYDSSIGVVARERVFMSGDGSLRERIPMRQLLTSWTSLYSALRRAFPAGHYHQGAELERFADDGTRVRAWFRDGREAEGDLLVAADGGDSLVRRTLLPDARPDYAGYVAWRGLVDEALLPEAAAAALAERFAFYDYPNAHILSYLVPGEGEAVAPGRRRYNWVWYRNAAPARLRGLLTDRAGRVRLASVPPGLLSPAAEADLRAAAERFLPPPFRDLVSATTEPFLQAIQDLAVPRMAFGRTALLGDAASIPRPHTAASTAKAAGNALALADALSRHPDVPGALRAWEPGQVEAGLGLLRHGQALGRRSQAAYPAGTPT